MYHDLIAQRLHACPMHLRSEMMLRVVAVKKPDPIVKFVVTANAPGKRLVRVTTIVPVVAVKVGKTMAEVPERKKKTDVTPVEDAENDECGNEQRQLCNSPESVARVLAFQFPVNRLWIFAEETEESILKRVLWLTVMSMLVDRNPIDCLTILIGPVSVSPVMLHVNAFVKNLAKTNGD